MHCTNCDAPTRVRNTYPETIYVSTLQKFLPMTVRYRSCAVCGITRKTVEAAAETFLPLGGASD